MTHYDLVTQCIIKQTDPRLSTAINRYGCRAMCLLAIPQFVAGRCLQWDDIVDILQQARHEEGVIVNDKVRTGVNEHRLINTTFARLGKARQGRQVGWTKEHYDAGDWHYCIAHYLTDGPDGHFVLLDRTRKIIYNPHDEGQAGYAINMREPIGWRLYKTWELQI